MKNRQERARGCLAGRARGTVQRWELVTSRRDAGEQMGAVPKARTAVETHGRGQAAHLPCV